MSGGSTVGDRAKLVRKEVGKTQSQLAEFLGLAVGTWQKIERDEGLPSGETLMLFGKLGINPGWLLTGLGPKRIDESDNAAKTPVGALDSQLLDRLGRAALQVYGDIKRNLPHSQVSGEAARLYNDLVELGVDLGDADAVEASIPLLQHRLKRRIEQAAADPATDKRRA